MKNGDLIVINLSLRKKKRASFGFVAENDDFVLITLRGTANIGDGLMDIFFAPIVPDDASFKGKYQGVFEYIKSECFYKRNYKKSTDLKIKK